MLKTLKIGIAETTISIVGDIHDQRRPIPPAYMPFYDSGQPQIRLRLHRHKPPVPAAEKIFSSPPIWSLYRHGNLSVIKIFDKLDLPGHTLIFDDLLQKADLYPTDPGGRLPDPFDGPIMELLLINYLAGGRGVILHACGIERDGKGYLFAGQSGAVKSALATLWDQQKGVEVLSDGRTIVRKQDGQFRMYGTPWHGDATFGSPRGVKLERIFFLGHGRKNAVRDLEGAGAMLQFLQCSFPPYWDAPGMESAMEIFKELATRVSCFDLSFEPHNSAIEFVRGII